MQKIITKNKTIQKFTSSLIIIFMLMPAVFLSFGPRQAEAVNPVGVPTNDFTVQIIGWKTIAKEVWKQLMMSLARRLINKVTQSTINWINSGFHGNPLFLENPQSFFKDIAKYEVRNLVDTFGYDSRRFPFGRDFALNIIDSYRRQLEDNAEYSLSKVINDPLLLERYRNDFYVGGWNGFLINTQYPQNNYLGFQMLATEVAARKLAGTAQTATQKVNTTLEQGLGFLSPKVCPTNPAYNNGINEFNRPSFQPTIRYSPPKVEDYATVEEFNAAWIAYDYQFNIDVNVERADWDQTNTCPGGLVSTTPGSVVANQIIGTMGSKGRQGELAAAMGNSLSAFFDALLTKFLDVGLNALSDRVSPPEPVGDGFNYGVNPEQGAADAQNIIKNPPAPPTPPEPPEPPTTDEQ